jgi:hypothetical protein
MYPGPAMSAISLAVMAVVVVALLATWLALVFIAARHGK